MKYLTSLVLLLASTSCHSSSTTEVEVQYQGSASQALEQSLEIKRRALQKLKARKPASDQMQKVEQLTLEHEIQSLQPLLDLSQ